MNELAITRRIHTHASSGTSSDGEGARNCPHPSENVKKMSIVTFTIGDFSEIVGTKNRIQHSKTKVGVCHHLTIFGTSVYTHRPAPFLRRRPIHAKLKGSIENDRPFYCVTEKHHRAHCHAICYKRRATKSDDLVSKLIPYATSPAKEATHNVRATNSGTPIGRLFASLIYISFSNTTSSLGIETTEK